MGASSSIAPRSAKGTISTANGFSKQNGVAGDPQQSPSWPRQFPRDRATGSGSSSRRDRQWLSDGTSSRRDLHSATDVVVVTVSCWDVLRKHWSPARLTGSEPPAAFSLAQLPGSARRLKSRDGTSLEQQQQQQEQRSHVRALIAPVFRKGRTARFTNSPEVWSFEREDDQSDDVASAHTGSTTGSATGSADKNWTGGSIDGTLVSLSSSRRKSEGSAGSNAGSSAQSALTDVTLVSTVTRLSATAHASDSVTVYPAELAPTDPAPLQRAREFTYYCHIPLPPGTGSGKPGGVCPAGRKVRPASMAATSRRTLVRSASRSSSIDTVSGYGAELLQQRLENLNSGSLEHGRCSSLSSVTSGADRHTRILSELIESSSVSSRTRIRAGNTRRQMSSASRRLPPSQQSVMSNTTSRTAFSETCSSGNRHAHFEELTPGGSTVHVEDSVSQAGGNADEELEDEGIVSAGTSFVGTDNTLEEQVSSKELTAEECQLELEEPVEEEENEGRKEEEVKVEKEGTELEEVMLKKEAELKEVVVVKKKEEVKEEVVKKEEKSKEAVVKKEEKLKETGVKKEEKLKEAVDKKEEKLKEAVVKKEEEKAENEVQVEKKERVVENAEGKAAEEEKKVLQEEKMKKEHKMVEEKQKVANDEVREREDEKGEIEQKVEINKEPKKEAIYEQNVEPKLEGKEEAAKEQAEEDREIPKTEVGRERIETKREESEKAKEEESKEEKKKEAKKEKQEKKAAKKEKKEAKKAKKEKLKKGAKVEVMEEGEKKEPTKEQELDNSQQKEGQRDADDRCPPEDGTPTGSVALCDGSAQLTAGVTPVNLASKNGRLKDEEETTRSGAAVNMTMKRVAPPGEGNGNDPRSGVLPRPSSAAGVITGFDVIIAAATEVLLENIDGATDGQVRRLLRAFRQGNSMPVKSIVTDFGELATTVHAAFTEAFCSKRDEEEPPMEKDEFSALDDEMVKALNQLLKTDNFRKDSVKPLVKSYQQKTNALRVRAQRALMMEKHQQMEEEMEKQQQTEEEDVQLKEGAKQLLADLDSVRKNIQDLRGEERKRFDMRLMQKIRDKRLPEAELADRKRLSDRKEKRRRHKSHRRDPPGTAPVTHQMELPPNSPSS